MDGWADLASEIASRRALLESGKAPTPQQLVVCIDDAETVDLPMSATEMLTSLVMAGPDLGILMVVAASTQALRAKHPTDWIRALLTLRRGLLLAPQAAEDYDFFGLRGRPQRMPKGRGFVCGEGAKHLVQIAHAE